MTAMSEGQPRTKRSKGFTINSIIGVDSDRRTDEQTSVCERVSKSPDSATRQSDITRRLSGDRVSDRGSDRGSDSDQTSHHRDHEHISHRQNSDHAQHHRDNEHISHRRDSEHNSYETTTHFEHDRLRRKDSIPHSAIENGNIQRSVSSLHRDAVRDLNFTTSRDGPSSETLKHFHETLMQNASQANTAINLAGMGMPFGHFDTQRHCRHPLAGLNIPGYPSPLPAHPQLHPGVLLNGATRDIRQMYPYIADRYPGYFHPRFGLGGMPGLFFQPYRKPKRIRTAFSPSQLLQLEKSFEKSHYVVGQERKDLANELQLSETQVKVWFQNRRTKYKRTKAEQDGGPGDHGPHSPMHEDESDISDIDDIDDVGSEYTNPHAYPAPIQTC